MLAEIGLFCLILAMLLGVVQALFLLPHQGWRACLSSCMPAAALLQALLLVCAFAALIMLRLESDFTVENVVSHSNLSLPTLYKVSGTWGNHEGSLLLWATLLSVFGACFVCLSRQGKDIAGLSLSSTAQAVLGIVMTGFLLFTISTSNPFARQFPPPMDGKALNPLLQDIALAMHPPLLYSGYVGFAVVFALAVGALIRGEVVGRSWATIAHPWIMLAWGLLSLGIGLGSWWAYRVLGWGGWWFWDPVENCALLPWLCATALLHANVVLKKRDMLAQWVVLLSIVTFGLCLLGTFLVRSGVLTSVHSFASDPERGIFILAYSSIVVGGALLLFALRSRSASQPEALVPFSREGMIIINNMFVLCACATVLLGTLYPMFMEMAGGGALAVGAPYFNKTFIPLMLLPLLCAGLTPFLAWKGSRWQDIRLKAFPAFLALLGALLVTGLFASHDRLLAIVGFGTAAWLAAASLKWRIGAQVVRGAWSVFLGHMGAAILVAGITGVSLWKEESQALMAVGDTIEVSDYKLSYEQSSDIDAGNYKAHSAKFLVSDAKGRSIALLYPEYRTYAIRAVSTSEPSISSNWLGDIYVVVGEKKEEGKLAVRAYYNPMIGWIWFGCLCIVAGGMASAFERKKR